MKRKGLFGVFGRGQRQRLKPGKPKGTITNCPHTDKPHCCRGMCRSCYQKWLYKNSKTVREGVKRRARKFSKMNPVTNARRQREYRKRHPTTFNKIMAKCYLRHLTNKERMKVIEELKNEPKRAKTKA